jgi:hypothetical protein
MTALQFFVSAVRGPIGEGEIPVIQILFFGPHLYASAHPAYIMASVFPFYGAVTLVASLLSASVTEFIYTKARNIIPLAVSSKLRTVDRKVDNTSAAVSDQLFLIDEKKGLAAATILLLSYGMIYSLLLIF